MQMPTVLDQIDETWRMESPSSCRWSPLEAAGASIARANSQEELDELDMTPRDVLIQYAENSFPMPDTRLAGGRGRQPTPRPALDSKGNPT